jgi:Zn-dependent M28 family amino/carboxypeptidase
MGAHRAARFIAEQFRAAGLEPAGDSGYFQRVPLVRTERANGRSSYALAPSFAARDTFPESRRGIDVNVIGRITGSDPVLKDSVVLVDAHFDHLGLARTPVDVDSMRASHALAAQPALRVDMDSLRRAHPTPRLDSVYNGADDDASGVVAVMEIARRLAAGPRPKRTIIFAATTGEEVGLLGTRWYMQHPVVPNSALVANLEIEMIGRPDSLSGGKGRAWLTGFERSTMGDLFAANGLPIVPDKRPSQSFFTRSDNIAFARMGVPAHTLSSFNLHDDYHQVTDDVSAVDFDHMAAVIDAATDAVGLLANGPAPVWKPGGKP